MAKLSNKMVALCSLAIGSIYTAGYILSEPPDVPAAQHGKAASVFSQNSIFDSQSSETSQTNTGTQQSKVYKDGTYYGQGSNRIGSVEVAVTLKNDTITSVEITNCTTSYSESYIDDLPNQVIQQQNANVANVSGATRSTEDFHYAVEEALQQARL